MNCLERFEKEVVKDYDKRNDDTIGSDSELIARTIAICFDELIAIVNELKEQISLIRELIDEVTEENTEINKHPFIDPQ